MSGWDSAGESGWSESPHLSSVAVGETKVSYGEVQGRDLNQVFDNTVSEILVNIQSTLKVWMACWCVSPWRDSPFTSRTSSPAGGDTQSG